MKFQHKLTYSTCELKLALLKKKKGRNALRQCPSQFTRQLERNINIKYEI